MEIQKTVKPRFVLGAVLVFIGGLYLLENFNLIPWELSHILISWPALMILVGVISLSNSGPRFFNVAMLVLGVLFMLPRLAPYIRIDEDVIFPVLIILLGLFFIFRSNRRYHFHRENFMREDGEFNRDRIEEVSIFGGGKKRILSSNFQGGNITAIFGGSEIDLSDCKLAQGVNVIDIAIIFGGTEIIVPEDWQIHIDVFPIFGGFSNKSWRDPNLVPDPSAILHIKGTVIFGGGEIKVRKYH